MSKKMLPEGWEVKKLGEVCTVIAGQSPEGRYYNNTGDGLPFYQGKKEFTEKYIGKPKTWTTSITKEALKGDILMSVRAPVGPINFSTDKMCIGRGLAAIRAFKIINKDYLFNFLLMHENEIVGNTGAVFNSISKTQIETIHIPVPPLPEQKRIVKILDEAFAAIDKAKANAEKNLANAKELFDSYLNGIFANPGEDWEEKKLGEIANVEYGYTDKSAEEGYFRYIRITDIDKNGELILKNKKYIKNSKETEKFALEENDLLMARTGATFAKVLIYKDYEPSVFASYLIKIKFKEKIKNELYWYFTKTSNYWDQANCLSSGSAQPHFNGSAVKQVVFSYPSSIEDQELLIKKFKILSTDTIKLEAIYQEKIVNLEELKKSILKKAFEGEL